jgi:hypothetical protein
MPLSPFNKTYLDLSSQARHSVEEHKDLGIRPEALLKELGETGLLKPHRSPHYWLWWEAILSAAEPIPIVMMLVDTVRARPKNEPPN